MGYQTEYGLTRELKGVGYDAAIAKVTEALKSEGFGILWTIDVKDTLKKKIDKDFRRYAILGACNPPLAHQALSAELAVGLLLPCNATVYEADDPNSSVVQLIKPEAMFAVAKNPALQPIMKEVDARLTRVMEKLA